MRHQRADRHAADGRAIDDLERNGTMDRQEIRDVADCVPFAGAGCRFHLFEQTIDELVF
jgi:hypothetical protein